MTTKERTSGRRRRTPRGVRIVDREAADKALAKRLHEERRQEALEDARREQARLDRRIEREKVEPAVGPAPGAAYAHHGEDPDRGDQETGAADIAAPVEDLPRLRRRFPDLPWEGDGEQSFAIGQARAMLRHGYNIRKVIVAFNVGLKWFDDIPIDELGFGPSDD